MMRFIPIFALALLGCGDGLSTGADGHQFEGREKGWPNEMAITIVEHPSVPDMRRSGLAAGAKVEQGRELQAWSAIGFGKCTIHIVNPDVAHAPEWVGHEVLHCKYGRWHK